MFELKLESLVLSLSVRGVAVVTGSKRTNSRPADAQAPAFLPSEWLPTVEATDPTTQPDYPTGMNPDGLRAGRPVRPSGSRLSRCLPGHAGATRRARGAGIRASKRPWPLARRIAPGHMARGFTGSGRFCPTATARGPRVRPVT
jgi:hypothetical protein